MSEILEGLVCLVPLVIIVFIMVVWSNNNSNSSCTENTLWFIRMGHDLDITSLRPWGDSSWHMYVMNAECKLCGAKFNRFGIKHAELIRRGIDPENY